MVAHLLGRKGAARIALIPSEVLDALNAGRLPTVNLNEFLALDLPRLTRAVAQQIGLDPNAEALADTLAMLGAFKPMKRHLHVARALYELTAPRADRDAVAPVDHRALDHAGLFQHQGLGAGGGVFQNGAGRFQIQGRDTLGGSQGGVGNSQQGINGGLVGGGELFGIDGHRALLE